MWDGDGGRVSARPRTPLRLVSAPMSDVMVLYVNVTLVFMLVSEFLGPRRRWIPDRQRRPGRGRHPNTLQSLISWQRPLRSSYTAPCTRQLGTGPLVAAAPAGPPLDQFQPRYTREDGRFEPPSTGAAQENGLDISGSRAVGWEPCALMGAMPQRMQ